MLLDLFPAVSVKDMKEKICKVTFSGQDLIYLKQTSLSSIPLLGLSGARNTPVALIPNLSEIISHSSWSSVEAEEGGDRVAHLNVEHEFF